MVNPLEGRGASGEYVPGLSVYRPVLSIVQTDVDKVVHAVNGTDIDPATIRLYLQPESNAALVTAGEVRYIHELLGVASTPEEMDKLASHLGDALPDSVDDPIDISGRSIVRHVMRRRKDREIFSIAPDAISIAEREAAKNAVNEHYDISDDSKVTPAQAWEDSDFLTGIWLARVRTAQSIATFSQLLEDQVEILPEIIKLGVASVDDF